MEQMIKVGNDVSKEFSENLGELIATVFKAAKENGMDQSTVVQALNTISQVIEVKQVSIANCNLTTKEFSE